MAIGDELQTWLARQWQHRGLWAYANLPLSWIYGWISRRTKRAYEHGRREAYRPSVPVIVIGNIYVGGTGKTPVTCALAQELTTLGFTPGLVSRGYGRQASHAPACGSGSDLDWRTYGDEPALIAAKTGMSISVHADRALAAQHLLLHDPSVDVILSDDGLQHHRLARDFEVLVQDERGIGNGWLLPAGPLRELPSRRNTVDLVLQRCQQHVLDSFTSPAFSVCLSRWRHAVSGRVLPAGGLTDGGSLVAPVIAVAAIGVPERFFDSVRSLGIELSHTEALADHQPIDLDWLERQNAGTILVTEKDAIKMPTIRDARIWVAETTVQWWQDDIGAFIEHKLAQAGIKRPR